MINKLNKFSGKILLMECVECSSFLIIVFRQSIFFLDKNCMRNRKIIIKIGYRYFLVPFLCTKKQLTF